MIRRQVYLTYRWDITGATTPGQIEPGSNNNEGVLHIHQNSPSEGLGSYPGWGGS